MTHPPWLAHYAINTELTSLLKTQTPPSVYRSQFFSILEQYKDYQKVYTDVYMSWFFNNIPKQKSIKLPRTCSIFSAEAIAILEAIKKIIQEEHPKNIKFSDSLSTLISIKNQFHPGDIETIIQHKLNETSTRNKQIT